MDEATIEQRARAWIAADPDPDTRTEGEALLAAQDAEALRERFGAHLRFGTAGMRGALGAGPNRMNRAVVRRVTRGLAAYVHATVPDAGVRGAVVGFDGRHKSRDFADEAAVVLRTAGIPVARFEAVSPTPRVAHAVTHLGAAVGIVITASHNPPGDNGYKVYWSDGAQIVPPHDVGISGAIDWDEPSAPQGDIAPVRSVPETAWADYLEQVLALRVRPLTGARAVYTAMHGVAWGDLERLLLAAGHQVDPVISQAHPDPDFPTVSFPNPEEPGALDLAMAQADRTGADLVLANDPDGDRLGVAVPNPDGTWRRLTGDQIGILLAGELLEHGSQVANRMVSTSIVSSTLLSRIAQSNGVAYRETLTGFKWIAREAILHDGPFVMGYEEALGYCIGEVVRDKDGLSAALLFLDLASACKAEGQSLLDRLLDLYRRYGFHATRQVSVRLEGASGAARIQAAMDALRASPPTVLVGRPVVQMRDVQTGEGCVPGTNQTFPVELPRSNVLEFVLDGGDRILVRPSGTEPKIKFYFEVCSRVGPEDDLSTLEQAAQQQMDAMAADVLYKAGFQGD